MERLEQLNNHFAPQATKFGVNNFIHV
jgi:aspartate aminotransferase, cytoplasmic